MADVTSRRFGAGGDGVVRDTAPGRDGDVESGVDLDVVSEFDHPAAKARFNAFYFGAEGELALVGDWADIDVLAKPAAFDQLDANAFEVFPGLAQVHVKQVAITQESIDVFLEPKYENLVFVLAVVAADAFE